jgi:hypothetical protein
MREKAFQKSIANAANGAKFAEWRSPALFLIHPPEKSKLIMKKFSFLFALLLITGMAFGQTVELKVTFKFLNIVEGYDHDCKTEVLIDGNSVGESQTVKESKGASFTVQVPTGKHDIRVVNWAYYEGEWEEHTVENEYSIDCTYDEAGHSFKKASKLFLVFDIDSQAYVSWKKAPKVKKPKKVKGEG